MQPGCALPAGVVVVGFLYEVGTVSCGVIAAGRLETLVVGASAGGARRYRVSAICGSSVSVDS